MELQNNKYPAYPLISCDPYFSVWSMSDKLTGDFTRHWTGKQQSMTGIITVDGVSKTFMGRMCHNPNTFMTGPRPIEQKSVRVTPLKTIYTFSDGVIELEVSFITPLVLSNLKLVSRPISYIAYSISSLDKKEHECSVYIDVSALLAVNDANESVCFGRTDYSVYLSSGKKHILEKSGDDLRINWGYLHLAARSGKLGTATDNIKQIYYKCEKRGKADLFGKKVKAGVEGQNSFPVLYYLNEHKIGAAKACGFVCVGYDDIHSLNYFGRVIDGYYKKDGESFSEALKDAVENYEEIMGEAERFDNRVMKDAQEVSENYAKLVSVAYRQTVAAHKLAWTGDKGVFVSKECFSNGCAATVDVTYPSIPLFLVYNPDLVEYMLNPVFDFANSKQWRYDFAPHDVGTYPLLTGQVYGLAAGELQFSGQMPIEECGNMILCVAALCRARKNAGYAKKHFDILSVWANYLVKFGLDPENQLCTDDFAGHLAHNCNLSVKAISGIAAWGMILGMLGHKSESEKYIAIAKDYAAKWKQAAFDGDHYRLAFDRNETWSIKYNLVWDKLFGLNIFDADIFETEVRYYKSMLNKYGLPLDSRSDYTKSDWQMWSTRLCDDFDYAEKIVDAMLLMLAETPDRVPFTDWYYTSTAIQKGWSAEDGAVQKGFQNRTVQGGLFIRLLKFDELN